MSGHRRQRRAEHAATTMLQAAVVAASLFAAACSSGNDRFEPHPDATLDADDLRDIVHAVMEPRGFVLVYEQEQPDAEALGVPGCFGMQDAGRCAMPVDPNINHAYRGEAGVGVQVILSVAFDADDQQTQFDSWNPIVSTGLLREVFRASAAGEGPRGRNGGWRRCDPRAEPTADDGCAWQERQVHRVGDKVKAWALDVLDESKASKVLFTRGLVVARVVVHHEDSRPPDALADEIADALDERIMEALSR